jgi:hypothetical protein
LQTLKQAVAAALVSPARSRRSCGNFAVPVVSVAVACLLRLLLPMLHREGQWLLEFGSAGF